MAVDSMDAAGRPAGLTDHVLAEIYHGEYRPLVRLAMLLLYDVPAAEKVVQDAFVATHEAWRRLRDADKALTYLRREVVSRSRSALRHPATAGHRAPEQDTDEPSAQSQAVALLERSVLAAALRGMPARQREAIVLRHYARLSEAETAATMGISRGAVKSHTARGMATLRQALEHDVP